MRTEEIALGLTRIINENKGRFDTKYLSESGVINTYKRVLAELKVEKENTIKFSDIKAKDLFEKLDFQCTEQVSGHANDDFIWYQKNEMWRGNGTKRTDIIFDLSSKTISANVLFYDERHRLLKQEPCFDLRVIQAIYKQIDELKWLKGRVGNV